MLALSKGHFFAASATIGRTKIFHRVFPDQHQQQRALASQKMNRACPKPTGSWELRVMVGAMPAAEASFVDNVSDTTDVLLGRRGFVGKIFLDTIEEWAVLYGASYTTNKRAVLEATLASLMERECRFLMRVENRIVSSSAGRYYVVTDATQIRNKILRALREAQRKTPPDQKKEISFVDNVSETTDVLLGRRGFVGKIFLKTIEEWAVIYRASTNTNKRAVFEATLASLMERECRFLIEVENRIIARSAGRFYVATDATQIRNKILRALREPRKKTPPDQKNTVEPSTRVAESLSGTTSGQPTTAATVDVTAAPLSLVQENSALQLFNMRDPDAKDPAYAAAAQVSPETLPNQAMLLEPTLLLPSGTLDLHSLKDLLPFEYGDTARAAPTGAVAFAQTSEALLALAFNTEQSTVANKKPPFPTMVFPLPAAPPRLAFKATLAMPYAKNSLIDVDTAIMAMDLSNNIATSESNDNNCNKNRTKTSSMTEDDCMKRLEHLEQRILMLRESNRTLRDRLALAEHHTYW